MFFNDFEQFKNKSFGIKTKFDKFQNAKTEFDLNYNILYQLNH